jgi:hypothetical protein
MLFSSIIHPTMKRWDESTTPLSVVKDSILKLKVDVRVCLVVKIGREYQCWSPPRSKEETAISLSCRWSCWRVMLVTNDIARWRKPVRRRWFGPTKTTATRQNSFTGKSVCCLTSSWTNKSRVRDQIQSAKHSIAPPSISCRLQPDSPQ